MGTRTAVLLLLLASPFLANPRAAQEPRSPGPGGVPLVRATEARVRVLVEDGVATTTISQVLVNDGAAAAEAIWLLPLPPGAAADGFRMVAGGVTMESDVLDAGAARDVYESIVRRKRDPGLLEYAGRGCLRARVFPIPPRATDPAGVTAEVVFRHVLPEAGGLRSWSLPLRAAGIDGRAPEHLVLELTIRSRHAIGNAFSPTPGLQVLQKDDHLVRASFEGPPARLADEPAVLYGLTEAEFGLDLLTHRAPGAEEGTFLALLSPRRAEDAQRVLAKELVLVLDVSGSMAGRKLEQAKGALRSFVGSLKAQDRFNVIPFATEPEPFFPAPVELTPESRDAALARIERLRASGGTNLGDALAIALPAAGPGKSDGHARVPIVVVLSDGRPTVGETRTEDLLAAARERNGRGARVFVLGVGDDVDTQLLDGLAADGRGARDYVREAEDIEVKASALFAKLAHPVLTDLELVVEGPEGEGAQWAGAGSAGPTGPTGPTGIELTRVVPARLPDLFRGDLLTVAGRYRGEGLRTLRLTGSVQGERRTWRFEARFGAPGDVRHDFVPGLWAERRVGVLLDAIRRNGPDEELLDEVRRLGTEHQIVTPYTSHLILEEGLRLAGGPTSPATGGGGPGSPGPGGPGSPAGWGPNQRSMPSSSSGFFLGQGEQEGPGAEDLAVLLVGSGILPEGSSPEELQALTLEVVRELRAAEEDLQRLGSETTGRRAVDESAYLAALIRGARGDEDALAERFVRRIHGKVFLLRGGVWTDRALLEPVAQDAPALPRTVVEAFSPEYFALLRARPELAPWFAAGTRLAVRMGDEVFEVRPPAPDPAEVPR